MANEVMMQAFEWDTPSDGSFYRNLVKNAKKLKKKWNRCTLATTNDQGWVRYGCWLWSL